MRIKNGKTIETMSSSINNSDNALIVYDEHYQDNGNDKGSASQKYNDECEQLFEGSYYDRLQTLGLKGKLRKSRFRSICWRIFLECLPEQSSEWITAANSLRQSYDAIRQKMHINPRTEKESANLLLNNPLSQEDNSPWNQFFQDSELKITIQQDVIRTFPEIPFFHTSKVQQMIVNILFCFAREYPHISYRQGMHELLAPIIYVLHTDQQEFLQVCETSEKFPEEARVLLDPSYTEHDAFFIFCQVMDVVESWYLIQEYSFNQCMDHFTVAPFSRPRETSLTSVLGVKLTKINEQILKRHDPELFLHLENLEIAPQIYGIRWLRLLFGREFPLQDLLQIWDAIFADSLSFNLVDYIFAAMLMCIRELLISGDYATCLKYLMKYPSISDIGYIVKLALYLRDPMKFSQPTLSSVQVIATPSTTHNSVHNTPSKNTRAIKHTGRLSGSSFASVIHRGQRRPKTLALPIISTSKSTQGKSSSEPATLESTSPSSDSEISLGVSGNSDRKQREKFQKHFRQPSDSIMHSSRHSSDNVSNTLPRKSRLSKEQQLNFTQSLIQLDKYKTDNSESASKEMVTLNSQHSSHHNIYRQSSKERDEMKQLKNELSELKAISSYCWHRMTNHLDRLQYYMIHQQLQHEDEMLLALAGLKRIRDILKGTINFSEEVDDSEYSSDGNINEKKDEHRLQTNA